MTRYFFNLRDGYAGYVDRTGVELADDEAAREHACVVATELIKNREIKARHWRIAVQDEGGRQLFEISFMTFDRTLQKLSPPAKEAMDKLSERRCALGEAIAESRSTQRQARAVVAKSRGKPFLAAESGEEILGSSF